MRGVRRKPWRRARPAIAVGEIGGLKEEFAGLERNPALLAPMMPASASGFSSSAITSTSGSMAIVCSLSSSNLRRASPCAHEWRRKAWRCQRHARVARVRHHVVGDIDQRGNAADTRSLDALLHPSRRRRLGVDAGQRSGRNSTGRRQAPRSAISRVTGCVTGTLAISIRFSGEPVSADTSRAIPVSDRQSARFGVSLSVSRRSLRSGSRGYRIRPAHLPAAPGAR